MLPPPRLLKIFVTHLGLHEVIVAAPSQRAAIEAWAAPANLFSRGRAWDTHGRGVYAIALEHPGRVFARPLGSDKAFKLVSADHQMKRAAAPENDGPSES